MKLPIYQVDAFTNKVFSGNYAAVVLLPYWLEKKLMQSIATENNLSETAFIVEIAPQKFHIRWFSPITEIDFCGHATLASAFVLFNLDAKATQLVFVTDSVGELIVNKTGSEEIEMTFPQRTPEAVTEVPDALLNALSIAPSQVLLSQQAYFAIFDDESAITTVDVDFELLKTLAPFDVVISAKSNQAHCDFISRYFWPANGGNEDPVTGSIHAGLAPYWANILGKNTLLAYQASTRGGYLKCQVLKNSVKVSGTAVQYLAGEISI